MQTIQAEGSILDELHSNQIPVLPPGAPFLLKSLSDENISMQELARIIERFPVIAARLITLSNSAWSAPVASITSLEMACARLGFGIVRSVSIALAVSSPFNSNHCPAFDPERFWCSALLTAEASSWLAQAASPQAGLDSATVRAAGLLHNLGLIWLTDKLPEEMQQVFIQSRQDPDLPLNQALQSMLGIECHDASGRLAQIWELPETLVIAISQHAKLDYADTGWEAAVVVGMAASMVSTLFHGLPWQADELRLKRLSISSSQADELFERLSIQFERTRKLAQQIFQA
ncbi:MAG: HDOD domain-containing protein [Gammaproteobacteria bacterium]|nr:HDOD domain-containing protein [Gammaproteobacteria bacterium]